MNIKPLKDAVIRGSRVETLKQVRLALEQQTTPTLILDTLVAAMDEVGVRYQCNQIFVPEMLLAARAMKEAMSLLEPVLQQSGLTPTIRVVIGTVRGDMHDIGKNLVIMMLRGANIAVVDLGIDVPAERFIAAAREHQAHLIGISGGLTTALPMIRQTVAAIRAANLPGISGGTVKIIVGGTPVTEQFAAEIGADGYSADAVGAVALVRKLVGSGEA